MNRGKFLSCRTYGLATGITPSTNLALQLLFYKALIAIKSQIREKFVFALFIHLHNVVAGMIFKTAVEAGAPEHIVGCVMNQLNDLLPNELNNLDIARSDHDSAGALPYLSLHLGLRCGKHCLNEGEKLLKP